MAIENLAEFNFEIEKFAKKIVPEAQVAFQKKIVLEILRRVVFKNPVGNPSLWKNPNSAAPGYVGGRSRGNWQVQIASTNEQEIPGVLDPTSVFASGAAKLSGLKPFNVVWIFNNLPYIVPLENGWSSQAPTGMVRITLSEVEAGLA